MESSVFHKFQHNIASFILFLSLGAQFVRLFASQMNKIPHLIRFENRRAHFLLANSEKRCHGTVAQIQRRLTL